MSVCNNHSFVVKHIKDPHNHTNHLIELLNFIVLPTKTNNKLTLSRIMSISEYFIPLTSTGMSLEQKAEEKWWEQRARIGQSPQAITHIRFLLWAQLNVTMLWQILELRSTARDLNQPPWGDEEEYHWRTRSTDLLPRLLWINSFNISTWVSVCVWYACVCEILLGEVSTQHFLTHWLLCQSKPELTGLQGNIFVLVLSPQ